MMNSNFLVDQAVRKVVNSTTFLFLTVIFCCAFVTACTAPSADMSVVQLQDAPAVTSKDFVGRWSDVQAAATSVEVMNMNCNADGTGTNTEIYFDANGKSRRFTHNLVWHKLDNGTFAVDSEGTHTFGVPRHRTFQLAYLDNEPVLHFTELERIYARPQSNCLASKLAAAKTQATSFDSGAFAQVIVSVGTSAALRSAQGVSNIENARQTLGDIQNKMSE